MTLDEQLREVEEKLPHTCDNDGDCFHCDINNEVAHLGGMLANARRRIAEQERKTESLSAMVLML